MVRLWPLKALMLVAGVAALSVLTGCTALPRNTAAPQTTAQPVAQAAPANAAMNTTATATPAATAQSPIQQLQHQVKSIVTGTPNVPPPAVEFICLWQNKLQQLPDPSRAGQMTTGLVGQVFLMQSAENLNQSAEVNGEMVLVVSDATPRNAPSPLKNEVWHFTKGTLAKMVTTDERFGRCIVLFLPWPDHWRDVTKVSVQARYDQPGVTPLFAQPTTVVLDYTTPTGALAMPGAGSNYNSVPDPRTVRQHMLTTNPNAVVNPVGVTAVQQTGVWSPPPPSAGAFSGPIYAPPNANIAPQGLWAPPQPNSQPAPSSAKEFQRMVIPRN
jgi:hypothetical protein